MILRKRISRFFLCDRLTLFGGKLKDSFVLAVEDKYCILHGLSDPLASIVRYKNQTIRSRRLREDWKEQRTLKINMVRSFTSKTVNKMLRKSHCSYRTSYALGISLLFIRPNTRYTPEHQDSLSFRLRQSNRTGHPSKTLGFLQSINFEKINK